MPRKTPSSSTLNVNSKSLTVNSSNVLKIPIPALFTSTFTGPNASSVFATTSTQFSSFATSNCSAIAFSPHSSANAFAPSKFKSVIATFAPSATNLRACIAPLPWAAPVIIAILPFNLLIMGYYPKNQEDVFFKIVKVKEIGIENKIQVIVKETGHCSFSHYISKYISYPADMVPVNRHRIISIEKTDKPIELVWKNI